MHKLVRGVGINDADYKVTIREEAGVIGGKRRQKLIWICPFYRVWSRMLDRCYTNKFKNDNPTYRECTTCSEWLVFSKFKVWLEAQAWQGMELDKDLLIRGNKIYSPETCVFVTKMVNMFIIERDASRGRHPIGAYFNTRDGKFQAQCKNPFSGKTENLGLYVCPQEAHIAWLKRKLELAKLLAAEQDNPRVAEALIKRHENYSNGVKVYKLD